MFFFLYSFHLSEHMNVHQGVTPYSCQECDKQFHSRALLRQHVQVHQQNTKVTQIALDFKQQLMPCKVCAHSFTMFVMLAFCCISLC